MHRSSKELQWVRRPVEVAFTVVAWLLAINSTTYIWARASSGLAVKGCEDLGGAGEVKFWFASYLRNGVTPNLVLALIAAMLGLAIVWLRRSPNPTQG